MIIHQYIANNEAIDIQICTQIIEILSVFSQNYDTISIFLSEQCQNDIKNIFNYKHFISKDENKLLNHIKKIYLS